MSTQTDWKAEAERYRKGMENWKRTAEEKDAQQQTAVTFHDKSRGNSGMELGHNWKLWRGPIPSVGDVIMDMRELPFKVLAVEWWGPQEVRLYVERTMDVTVTLRG